VVPDNSGSVTYLGPVTNYNKYMQVDVLTYYPVRGTPEYLSASTIALPLGTLSSEVLTTARRSQEALSCIVLNPSRSHDLQKLEGRFVLDRASERNYILFGQTSTLGTCTLTLMR